VALPRLFWYLLYCHPRESEDPVLFGCLPLFLFLEKKKLTQKEKSLAVKKSWPNFMLRFAKLPDASLAVILLASA